MLYLTLNVCYHLFTDAIPLDPLLRRNGPQLGQQGWMALRGLEGNERNPMGRKILDETREIDIAYDEDAKSQALKAAYEDESTDY